MSGIRIYKKRPDHWPDPETIPGRYDTPFGVLVITDKGTSSIEAKR